MSVFVARQPIFDENWEVLAYELLFRSGLEEACVCLDGDGSTLDVIANSFFVIGFEQLTAGKRAFINFTRNLLTEEIASLLPKDRVVMEILEDVEPDDEVLASCRKLKELGYSLAVDDVVLASSNSPFIEFADIVKVDFLATPVDQREELCRSLAAKGVIVLAEKVETMADFEQARKCGCSQFQGYFFAKPVISSGTHIAGNKLAYLRVLNEVNKAGMSYDDLGEVIRQDVALTYKLLRFMNSAWFGFKAEINSIKHALVLLGPKEIRKWFALVALRHMATDKPSELIIRSTTMARFGEMLGPMVDMKDDAGDLFLMGLFSFIDALTDMPMDDVLERIPLSKDVKDALAGQSGRFKDVHDSMLSYEMGQWNSFSASAAALDLDEQLVPPVFADSLKWANDTFAEIA